MHSHRCDAAKYPIAKKKISLEFLREKIHLRTRTNTIAAIARVRSALAYATHTFFNQNGFLYVHTPCITQSDCEGAGEMFQVTTMLGQAEKDHMTEPPPPAAADVDALKAKVAAAGDAVKEAKQGEDKAAVKPALDAMMKLRAELEVMEKASRKVGGLFRTAEVGGAVTLLATTSSITSRRVRPSSLESNGSVRPVLARVCS